MWEREREIKRPSQKGKENEGKEKKFPHLMHIHTVLYCTVLYIALITSRFPFLFFIYVKLTRPTKLFGLCFSLLRLLLCFQLKTKVEEDSDSTMH